MPENDSLSDLITRHAAGDLTAEESERFHALLEHEISFGSPVPGLNCPSCGRPVIFTFAWGATICAYLFGGCGKTIGIPVNRLQLREPPKPGK